jgi:hypothetical protein
MSYDCRKPDWSYRIRNLGKLYLLAQVRDLTKFRHNLPRTLNMKIAVNELSFPLVTHTVNSSARFGSYKILN